MTTILDAIDALEVYLDFYTDAESTPNDILTYSVLDLEDILIDAGFPIIADRLVTESATDAFSEYVKWYVQGIIDTLTEFAQVS